MWTDEIPSCKSLRTKNVNQLVLLCSVNNAIF